MIKKVYGFCSDGETCLKRTYVPSLPDDEIKHAVLAEKTGNIICSGTDTIVFSRFCGLFIVFVVENENEMYVMALINNLMEMYDKFFGNACELHFIYNFRETHIILDNYIANGKCIEEDPFEVIKHAYCTK